MRRQLDMMGITETKMKRRGTVELDEGNVLIYIGVDKVNSNSRSRLYNAQTDEG